MIQELELTETRAIIRDMREIAETFEHEIRELRRTHTGLSDPYLSREQQWVLADRIQPMIALLETQRPHVPQTANQVFRTEALLHFSLGLPFSLCWQILDLAEYWVQIVDHVEHARLLGSHEPDTWAVPLSIPAEGFKSLRKVVVAVAGNKKMNREVYMDMEWESFEIQTGGDLPSRSVTFVNHYDSLERDIPPIHVFRWDYGVSMGDVEDDKNTQQVLRGFRPNDHFTVSITAPGHRGWWDHVVMLRTELYYSCV
ncbi:uncharacterized protein B0H18DRAFT_1213653 [Fomitopsis serialis]|uniref:uncharacterized protein n=1 Tax=Fomitopsis serialis TaxID=139415 RepID=UPI002008622A|nr:uncharacterized protein B0H18DRAFT_1213653 [Neoantrodia serialis]KAH9919849.1 hypothetical protein B0H18DRAFT_1213653 [Neoantrodia serialis]